MKEAYADLDEEYSRLEGGSKIPEREKIDKLLAGMQPRDGSRDTSGYSRNIQLQVAIGTARTKETFLEAGNHLQGQISLIFTVHKVYPSVINARSTSWSVAVVEVGVVLVSEVEVDVEVAVAVTVAEVAVVVAAVDGTLIPHR